MAAETADVVVIGVGAVGAATVLHLARRGVDVIGIDRFHPPHDHGSSHGETRVTRLATGEGAEYVPFVRRSHELWRELEEETGETLLRICGFLAVDGSGGEAVRHGRAGFFDTTVEVARAARIPHEVLDPAETMRRYPGLRLHGAERVFYEPSGGIVHPERAIATQIGRARSLGARFAFDEPVLAIAPTAAGVEVTTPRRTISAASAVIAAGAWTPRLAGEPALRLLRQTLHWFEPVPEHFSFGRFPPFLWLHGPEPEDSFYGFPVLQDGPRAMKIATEQFVDAIAAPGDVDRQVPASESRRLHRDHIRGRLTGLGDAVSKASACLYTHAADGRFLIDRDRQSRHMLVVSACSGHGFKHSAAVGEHVAEVVAGDGELLPHFQRARFATADAPGLADAR